MEFDEMNDSIDTSPSLPVIVIRGGGDLATGVALRLHRVGIKTIITELEKPLAVRRSVAFSDAIYKQETIVEEVTAKFAGSPEEAACLIHRNVIPVLVDPGSEIRGSKYFKTLALVDARMTKRPPDLDIRSAPFVIGLGPGFLAGENCHAVIETNRGHNLGRVIWCGGAEPNTGIPGKIGERQSERVLRAPVDGKLHSIYPIGTKLKKGAVIAEVSGIPIKAPFDGVLRGLLPAEMVVKAGMKIGDLDPRNDSSYTQTVSEKSLAIGGGVLEALLSRPEIRCQLWT